MQFPQKHPQQHIKDIKPNIPVARFSATGFIVFSSGVVSSYNTIDAGLRTQQLTGNTTYAIGNPSTATHHFFTNLIREGFSGLLCI